MSGRGAPSLGFREGLHRKEAKEVGVQSLNLDNLGLNPLSAVY